MPRNSKANSVRQEAKAPKAPKRPTVAQMLAPLDEAAKSHIADANDKANRIKQSMSKRQPNS